MKKKLGIQDFADYIMQHEGVDRQTADAFVRSFFDIIEQGLNNDKFVKIKGFGTFKLVAVSERESVNINTGERFQISGHTKVSFTPDTTMKELVNRPFAHFEAVDLNDDTDTKEFEVIDDEMENDDNEAEDDTEGDETDETLTGNNETEAPTTTSTLTKGDTAPQPSTTVDDNIIELADEPVTPVTDEENDDDAQQPQVTSTTTVSTSATDEEAPNTNSDARQLSQPTPTTTVDTDIDNNTVSSSPTSPHVTPNAAADATETKATDDDIVVTSPTPISTQPSADNDAPSTGATNTNNTLGYTYNEVPLPHKRNWWKVISITLLMLLLIVASYFVGYYRMLCPTCNDNEPIITEQPKPQQVQPTTPPAATEPKPSVDTTTVDVKVQQPTHNKVDTPATAPTTAPKAEAVQTNSNKTAEKDTPKRPATHCVAKGENVYRIARKYYGNDSYAEKIIKANHLKDANTIVVGMELKLP